MDVNKTVIIGIVVVGIIIGILAVSLFDSLSISKNGEIEEKGPILANEDESKDEKPQGKNLSIEFDEKMGFTDP